MKSHYCEAEGTVVEYEGECNWCGEKEMTPKERAAMQQALEALENAYENGFLTGITGLKTIDIITALREALAEIYLAHHIRPKGKSVIAKMWVDELAEQSKLTEDNISHHKLEQEPVYAFRRKGQDSFCTCDKERYEELADKPWMFEVTTFYSHPVRTKDLTDSEIRAMFNGYVAPEILLMFRAIIAADRRKNK